MMRALLDTNVVLDYLLEREPFVEDAEQVIDAHRSGKFQALISAMTPVNLFYITRNLGQEQARSLVERTLNEFQVSAIDLPILRAASLLPMRDYEDAVQAVCALAQNADVIVTRDVKDYANSPIRALTPAEFVAQLA